MSRPEWCDRPHEVREDVNDGSMCLCGLPIDDNHDAALLRARSHTMSENDVPMMDRPAYELVRLIEAQLDDADQITDTPQRPNQITVWGIRMLLEPYGGKPHRWQWPLCFECKHQMPLHNYGPCDLCDCPITPEEIADGARDDSLDEAVEQPLLE